MSKAVDVAMRALEPQLAAFEDELLTQLAETFGVCADCGKDGHARCGMHEFKADLHPRGSGGKFAPKPIAIPTVGNPLNVNLVRGASKAFGFEVEDEMRRLPPTMVALLRAEKIQVFASPTSNVAGAPRGSLGYYSHDTRSIVINQRTQIGKDTVENYSVRSTVRHEVGHVLDRATKDASHTWPEFVDAWKADVGALDFKTRRELSYFTEKIKSNGGDPQGETFAEMFAELTASRVEQEFYSPEWELAKKMPRVRKVLAESLPDLGFRPSKQAQERFRRPPAYAGFVTDMLKVFVRNGKLFGTLTPDGWFLVPDTGLLGRSYADMLALAQRNDGYAEFVVPNK